MQSHNALGYDYTVANITEIITRPETQRLDTKPKLLNVENGIYTCENFEVEQLGRWQIMSKVMIGALTTLKSFVVVLRAQANKGLIDC